MLVCLPSLHTKPADLVHGLGLQPEVRADRNIVAREMLDDLDLAFATFQFDHHRAVDHHRAAFLHHADRILERLIGIRITHERHVGDKKRTS
jgi:hypothetical protein